MGRPDKPLISRDRVVGVALDIIDAQGLSSLNLERVAKKIGVKAPSLYYHFKNKSELLSQVAMRILKSITLPVVDSDDWENTLINLCVSTRRAILRHPNAAPLLLQYFPRHIFLDAYDFWTAQCPHPQRIQLVILEGSEKLTFGSALFACASRSYGTPPMPEIDIRQLPSLAKAARSNPFDEEGLFIETLRKFLVGIRVLGREGEYS